MDILTAIKQIILFIVLISYVFCTLEHDDVGTTGSTPTLTIMKGAPISVNYGRAVMIESNHINIEHSAEGKCQVKVLIDNPETSMVGTVIPSIFPCSFQPNTVYYQHYGSMSRSVEVVSLHARLDTDQETKIIPFTLTVNVGLHQPFEILKNVENLLVDEVGGLSEPLSKNVMHFHYNHNKQKCQVRFLPINNGPPYFGSLVNASSASNINSNVALKYREIPCSDFIKGNLRYIHRRSQYSTNRDYLPLVVEVYNKETTEMEKQEYVQVPVRIRRAPENQPPIVNYNEASYSIQVDQLMLTALTPSVIKVEDRETDGDAIVFNITQDYKETDGYLVHTDDSSIPVRTFYQKDILDLKIAYKASDNLSTSQRMQQIWMEARDSHGANSAPFYIIVIVKPTNSFAPQVIRNEKLTMLEGQSRAITSELLNIRDPDNESEAIIVVTHGLNNGRLEMLGARVDQFTIKDIDNGNIRYVHDGSDTYSDNIAFRISDGKHDLEILFIILIIPQDDQAPRLKYNTGLKLNEGKLKIIDQFHLSATDVDSDDTKVKYQVSRFPKAGSIVYRESTIPEDYPKWKFIDERFERNISEFYQTDIILGKIFYRHSGDEIFHDYFTFYLSDEVPNKSGLKTFIININSKDDLSPIQQKGSTLMVKTEEGKTITFSKQSLSYTDGDSIDSDLTYKIIRQPYFSNSPQVEAGKIVSAHNRSKILQEFSQKHVNHFKVVYLPPDIEIGNTSKTILFHFDVQDRNGNVIINQTFEIVVVPVNNKPPVFVTSVLLVPQCGRKNLTRSHLSVYDEDTNSTDITFLLKRQPRYGVIVYKGNKLQLGGAVSFQDIMKGNLLQYVHVRTDSVNDDIKFMISDQMHMVPAKLQIEILPVRSNTMVISLLQKKLSVQENGIVEITRSIMDVSGDSEHVEKMEIKVVNQPSHGVVENEGTATDTFRWIDVAAGKIAYRHTSGEIGVINVHDNVSFAIANTSKEIVVDGELYGGLSFDINIMPVDSQPPVLTEPMIINVTEGGRTSMTLNITDEDTDMSDVTCVVTKQPIYGFIENITPVEGSEIKRDNIQVKRFTAEEMELGNIRYVQDKYKRIEPSSDAFNIRCNDGNNTSPVVTVYISIKPVNDEIPIIFAQTPITGFEDDLVLFDLSKINPFDRDLPKDVLTITVVKQPVNGELMLQKMTGIEVATTFTYEDLSGQTDSTVMYQHKGTETRSDEFILSVNDGIHTVNKTVKMNIVPMDDERPQLIVNTGLHIDRGETKLITTRNLKAEDLDSLNSGLTYIVTMESIFGKLQKRISENEYKDLHSGSNFTQGDINDKRLRYVHINLKGEERDSVRFDVTDGWNRLINQIFHIVIASEDIILPEVVNKGIELPENSRKFLTTDMLSASDLNSPDEELEFIVTKTPLRGYLEHANYDGIPLTRFTQLDLAANKISYVHTSSDELKTDHFEFEVTDGHNKIFRMFRIKILSVDNKKPTLDTSEILVYEDQEKIITPFELSAVDNDTSSNKIFFTVHKPPKYGLIVLAGKTRTYRFTQQDIDNNRITYRNLRTSKDLVDQFSVTVSDGTHTEFYYPAETVRIEPVEVSIKIKISDKNAPELITNNGGSILHNRHSRTFFRFSVESLQAIDSHSSLESITYIVTKPPKEGRIINIKNKKKAIDRFTQHDINKRLIEYELKKDSNVTSDIFLFDISDSSGNILKEQSFNLFWARVCVSIYFEKAFETDGTIDISFKRYGNLQNIGFSTVEIRNLDKHKGVHEKEEILHWKEGSQFTTLTLTIIDNKLYERSKKVMLSLRNGVNVLIGQQCNMHVEITDPEDEPTVFMTSSSLKVAENIDVLEIPIKRIGDIHGITSVYCITQSGSARGTTGKGVSSYHDYISKYKDLESSLVTFEENESMKFCRITIVDDTMYEDEETFLVQLLPHFGGRIGLTYQNTSVIIERDPVDEPVFFLEKNHYTVKENAGFALVNVHRKSKDLNLHSYIQIATRQMFPVSAEANKDYKPIVKTLEFKPDVTTIEVEIVILDDVYRPRMEGEEKFTVVLFSPRNGRLNEDSYQTATVVIEDYELDKPLISFKESAYRVGEDAGTVLIPVIRTGDPLQVVNVRCYTRQRSAKVSVDFIERKNVVESLIKFERKDTEKYCKIEIVDDETYEGDESFDVFIESQQQQLQQQQDNHEFADVIQPNRTAVTIVDNDKPVVSFSERKYFTHEPSKLERERTIQVKILRTADKSKRSRVTVMSKDGSAMAGLHYKAIVQTVTFEPTISEVSLNVTIFHVHAISVRLAFSLLMETDVEDPITKIASKRAVVSIEEKTIFGNSATFPLNPIVVSLADYENTRKAKTNPVNGYPLICVTACDLNYRNYRKTKAICDQENLINKRTTYRWQIESGKAVYNNGMTNQRFEDITPTVFFTNINSITLDSIYFKASSRIRCIAQAYSAVGGSGLESTSDSVTISPTSKGLCTPRDTVQGSTPFSAQASYVVAKDDQHKKMVHIKVLVPHQDGMLPIISTKRLTNFNFILGLDLTRTTEHACSNLLNFNDIETKYGFLNSLDKKTSVYSSQPYQYDSQLRGNNTVNFYQHLNLDSCLWTFESYYDINELVTKCGANMDTSEQVRNAVQSSMIVTIPLFVSYLYRNHDNNGFVNFNHQSSIRLTAVYDTGALWDNGIELLSNGKLNGELFPTSIVVMQKDRRLLLKFNTKARFRGVFLPATKDGNLISTASSTDQPSLTFTLKHIQSEATYNEPQQDWEMTSDMAVRDYSGTYTFKLIPCIVDSEMKEFHWPPTCTPNGFVEFNLPLSIHQMSQPVEAIFTLNTLFFVLKNEEQFLEPRIQRNDISSNDIAFEEGDTIYGRVLIDSLSSIAKTYRVRLEKVFLCAGKGGYIPEFNPDDKKYGCMVETNGLMHRLKVLDRSDPETQIKAFSNTPFNAEFLSNELMNDDQTDGFSLDSTPLFKDKNGRTWFLHVIYKIRVKKRRRSKREQNQDFQTIHDFSLTTNKRLKRTLETQQNELRKRELRSIGNKKGTNLKMLTLLNPIRERSILSSTNRTSNKNKKSSADGNRNLLIAVVTGVSVLLLIVVLVIVYKKNCRKATKKTNNENSRDT